MLKITRGNYKQILIEQKKELQSKDEVIFTTPKGNLFYTVYLNYLGCGDRENAAIFNDLGLDKDSFSLKYYGYDSRGGDWPSSHDNDYKALTRLVIGLYEEIERQYPCKKAVSESSERSLEKSKETNFVLPKLKTKLIKIVL